MMYENYANKGLEGIYNRTNANTSHEISNWGTKTTQENNFKQVIGILKSYRPKSLLDVGSGIGSIQSFLPRSIDYSGIDVVPWIVERAATPRITCADIKTYTPERTYEATIALGSFNIGVPFSDVLLALDRMYELCTKVSVVSISYLYSHEVDELRDKGYAIIINPIAFHTEWGDKYILIKQK